ncbi:hypothetical protein IQ07DRAFT_580042 [Pyrenochaeta sp. DS3sAY3a]|nr:hypothetical protein IQ07DRAFT_580042 [Pyrenochaeta sp. DS3sAY3a]
MHNTRLNMWHARDIIAVVQLAFYIPAALLATLVCFRHGFISVSGWLYTIALCIVRIGGAICQFLLHINQTRGLVETTLVFDSIGLCPLLMATLGILGRSISSADTKSSYIATPKSFLPIQLIILTSLILGIIGATTPHLQPHNIIEFNSTAKASVIFYIVAYAGILITYSFSIPHARLLPRQERKISLALLVALPFIFVRLAYAACAIFMHTRVFSVVRGNEAVYGGMAIVEEFIVIAMYIALGFALESVPEVGRETNPAQGNGRRKERGKERRHSKDGFEMRSLRG